MGLLDDAIREHLDLKRRRGADPAESSALNAKLWGQSAGRPRSSSRPSSTPKSGPDEAEEYEYEAEYDYEEGHEHEAGYPEETHQTELYEAEPPERATEARTGERRTAEHSRQARAAPLEHEPSRRPTTSRGRITSPCPRTSRLPRRHRPRATDAACTPESGASEPRDRGVRACRITPRVGASRRPRARGRPTGGRGPTRGRAR